ncbi:MAG: histone deacetylase [Proteobacteria bacterium]|nr:histone deacetylase [Pseudomonadota bacterium]MBU1687361.1 histone deacetylase [Pseudomonadota bacterium]
MIFPVGDSSPVQTLHHITHSRFLRHDTGSGEHPETPARLEVINLALGGCLDRLHLETIAPKSAPRTSLLRIHSENYLLRFEETALAGHSYLSHPDNQLCYETYEIALLSAGAGLAGITLAEETTGPIFCSVRPPGHHAEVSLALGFCFINNVAVAARYWQEHYNRRRIAIIDFDAHHGNGIQTAFEEDPEVFYISIHEHPTFSFPGTGFAEEFGTGPGWGATLNIPLLPGKGDNEVKEAFLRQITPALDRFQPEALLVAAGFDGHRLDDMSGLAYTTELFGWLGSTIAELAHRHCQGRLVSILEGGYHLETLGASVLQYCQGLTKK